MRQRFKSQTAAMRIQLIRHIDKEEACSSTPTVRDSYLTRVSFLVLINCWQLKDSLKRNEESNRAIEERKGEYETTIEIRPECHSIKTDRRTDRQANRRTDQQRVSKMSLLTFINSQFLIVFIWSFFPAALCWIVLNCVLPSRVAQVEWSCPA